MILNNNKGVFNNARENLLIPVLSPLYDKIAQPMAWTILRLAVGGMLMHEGWPKIIDPLAQIAFLEKAGYHPGWLWSPTLAGLQFIGGLLIAVGLFTRPAALANGVMLALTLVFHLTHPYGDAFLTAAGVEALKAGSPFFAPAAVARLGDAGALFLDQVQTKAELASLFWTGTAFLYAAFGGGYLALDRLLLKKVF